MNIKPKDQKELDNMQKEFDEMMGEKQPHNKFWDLLEVADDGNSIKRACPKCGDDDCKYALHDKAYSKCDVSILCNQCRHSETANNPDYSEIINNWHKTA